MITTPHLRATQRYAGRIQIEIHCRRCGVAFVPSSDAIRAGPQAYRYCPDCRTTADAAEKFEVRV